MKSPTSTKVLNEEKKAENYSIIDAIKSKDLKNVAEYLKNNGTHWIFEYDTDGFSPMHWAAINGNLEVVKYLLELKANPLDCYNQRLQRPIHWAATKGHVDVVKLLLQHGENVNVPDKKGYTPLITSAQYGHIPLCSFLIGCGAKLEIEDTNGDNAMHWASYKGYSELVSLLIYFGLDAAKQDKHGQTALHIACIDGNMATVKLVADLVDLNIRDNNGNTPMSIAKGRKFEDIYEFLERKQQFKLSKKRDFRTLIFGSSDNTKALFILAHIVLFCFQIPLYIHYFDRIYPGYKTLNYIYWIINIVVLITLECAHLVKPGYLTQNTDDYKKAIKMMTYQGVENRTYDELTKSNARLCHTCKLVKPLRSSHCKNCNRCVLAFDHHCAYIATCVGYYNRIWFFVFSSATLICACFNVFFCYIVLWETPFSYPLYTGVFFCICFLPLASFVVIYTLKNIVCNLTTNEFAKLHKYDYLKDSNGKFKNIFNKGVIQNIRYYFHLAQPNILETSAYKYENKYD